VSDAAAKPDYAELEQRLAYSFTDSQRLSQALTHRSFSSTHNERLEFLGDSILNLVIADALYHQFPTASEGDLSRLRSGLVKGTTLTELATDLGLGDFLRLGAGEAKSGGRRRASILADTVEALIGAVYLDADMSTASLVTITLFRERLAALDIDVSSKDPKTRLQELVQGKKQPLPVYSLKQSYGKAHERRFIVECRVVDLEQPTEGEGSSRRDAEQVAAHIALEQLLPS